MKKILFTSLLLINGFLCLKAQNKYEYMVIVPTHIDSENFYYGGPANPKIGRRTFEGINSVQINKVGPEWKLISDSEFIFQRGILIFEKSTQTNAAEIESKINSRIQAVKADLESKIENVATAKANEAASQLRVQLIDAIKDASLFDGKYKDAVIDAAIEKFKAEVNKTVQEAVKEALKNN